MIRTFEELFEKMETDGRKKILVQVVYESLQKDHAERRSGIISDNLKFCIRYRESWIDGYLDCLCEDGYISSEECEELIKTLQFM